jgi:hypothetical protein
MSFFNQQHYLDNMGETTRGEMQVKDGASPLTQPTSPEKRLLKKLAAIPEATPGPNAFAQQEARLERHRLDSNAFYQQEMQRRMASPPTIAHPALRQRSASDPPTPPRESYCTTMSPFINAGTAKESSPPLKLVPSIDHLAQPTMRGVIEERREQLLHEQSGSDEDRTPVFVSTSTFAKSAETPKKRSEKHKEVTIAEPPVSLPVKTPKRSILEKLRMNTSFRSSTSSPPIPTTTEPQRTDDTASMPVKAKAILGTSPTKRKGRTSLGASPSKSNLPRSPSKRKGFFGRKSSGVTDSTTSRSKSALSTRSVESEQPPQIASAVTKTPPTAFSDPTHYSYNWRNTRNTSTSHSEAGTARDAESKTCSIARSQSLKYFDHSIPPTPPTKDTPPEEKARREVELSKKSSRLPFHDDSGTPTKHPSGVVSTSDRLSPTRFGSYGYRDNATLVTRPSMYSLHASVVPNLTEPSTFEEMKARIDGLGLEGFNMPPENKRSPKPAGVYSPSVYSTDWNPRPSSAAANISPSTPYPTRHSKTSSDNKSKGSSSNGEIPVVYPELAKDPSYSDITAGNRGRQYARVRQHLDVSSTSQGQSYACDDKRDSLNSRSSVIITNDAEEDLDRPALDSPTSFSHPSATPSPLHCLPATTYKPPARKSSRQAFLTPSQPHTRLDSGLGIKENSRTPSESRSRGNKIFDNAPSLPAHLAGPNSRGVSPVDSLRTVYRVDDANVDPQKPCVKTPEPTDKLDRMLAMLDKLESRNNEIHNIREEMRASNARLDNRLAAVETLHRGSPVPSSQGSDELSNSLHVGNEHESKRISTGTAHDFYRQGPNDLVVDDEETCQSEEEKAQADTIAELRETNSKLLEMVSGFAERIKSLEGRYGGNGRL